MTYFLLIIILSLIVLANSLHHTEPKYDKINTKRSISTLIYFIIIFLIAATLGLRGNMDEYSKFYILVPKLSDFIANFSIYGDNERFSKYVDTASVIAYEKGFFFTFIIALMKSMNLTSQSILIFFSSTSVLIHGYYFRKYSPYAFIALLFYISHEIAVKEWISIRQALVSALILPSVYFVVNKKRFKFYFLLIFGFLIQYINILTIFLIFLNKKYSIKFILSIFAIALIIHYFEITRLIILNDFFINAFPDFIENYFFDEVHGKQVSIFHLKLLQQIIIISFILINYKKFDQLSHELKYFNILFNTYAFGTFLMIIFSSFSIFSLRFNGHFYVVEPILVSYMIWYVRPRLFMIIIIILFCLSLSYFNYVYLERVTPYQFLIQINSLYLIK